MMEVTDRIAGRSAGWIIACWAAAAILFAAPFVAMQVTPEVAWTASDFVIWGVMLGCAAGAFTFLARGAGGSYRLASLIAAAAGFFLVWVNLAVGVIGSERNDANLMYAGVLAVAVGGSLAVRGRPAGMARAMIATALAQVAVGTVALAFGLGRDGRGWPWDVVGATAIFAIAWLTAAALHRHAATYTR